ncbi:MAG: class I SAM-dependent methyltransferase [Chloroflexi bacterium]|nr:class I SAM-dependent methyltransferase [Chloroflexota bacterium]
MSHLSDQGHLLERQYRTSVNLQARMELHRRFGTGRGSWFRWLLDQMEIPPRARILELGCGTGALWRENLDRIASDWEVTLSDLSEGMLAEARRNLEGSGHRFRFRRINAQDIPVADAHFDVVIANHMLYHVPDRGKALAEIRRVLRPGGRFYAATNGRNHMRELQDLLARFVPERARDVGLLPGAIFGLESGREQVAAFFGEVTVLRKPNPLVVTEAEPLVAYVLSLPAESNRVGDRVEELTAWVQGELDAHGAIQITTDTGLIAARS